MRNRALIPMALAALVCCRMATLPVQTTPEATPQVKPDPAKGFPGSIAERVVWETLSRNNVEGRTYRLARVEQDLPPHLMPGTFKWNYELQWTMKNDSLDSRRRGASIFHRLRAPLSEFTNCEIQKGGLGTVLHAVLTTSNGFNSYPGLLYEVVVDDLSQQVLSTDSVSEFDIAEFTSEEDAIRFVNAFKVLNAAVVKERRAEKVNQFPNNIIRK